MSASRSKRRIICITKGDRSLGSSRLRVYAVMDVLRERGWTITITPLQTWLTRVRKEPGLGASCWALLFARVTDELGVNPHLEKLRLKSAVSSLGSGDVLLLQKVVLGEEDLESAQRKGCRIVVDLDDLPWWLQDRATAEERARGEAMLRRADVAVGGSPELAEVLGRYCRTVRLIPTSVDTIKYVPEFLASNIEPVIGWSGSKEAGVFLEEYCIDIKRVSSKYGLDVVLVGGARDLAEKNGFRWEPWSEETEARAVPRFLCGLSPLPDTLQCRCKCGYKAILYMACGVPPLVSRVGVHRQYIQDGDNGFLFSSPEEFRAKLDILAGDRVLASAIGMRGRRWVQEHLSLPKVAREWESLFEVLTK